MKWSMKNPKMMDSVYRLLSNVLNFFLCTSELNEKYIWCRLKGCIDEFLDSLICTYIWCLKLHLHLGHTK